MSQLEDIAARRRSGGFNARDLIRHDGDWAACYTCRKRHALRGNNADHDYLDFVSRHPADRGCVCLRMTPDQMRAAVLRSQQRRRLRHDSILEFTHNASVLEAFQSSDQSLDLTSFNSLGSSATAGWSSNWIDNSSNLYVEYMAALTVAAVNTAPGSDRAFYLFGATSLNTTDRPTTGAASGGTVANSSSTAATLTFPSISTLGQVLPLVRTLPYPVQNALLQTPLFCVSPAFNGAIGLYLWLPILNFSGFTVAASGNAYKYRGLYYTVA